MKSLNLLLQRLADAGPEFVVIGGYAGVLHGSSYVTNDLDVCVVLTRENVARLRTALADLNPVHRLTRQKLSFLKFPPADQDLANVYLETDGGIVDVLGSVLGVGDYPCLRQHAIEIPLFGRRCWVMSLEDLIKAKEALGREKDLLTAKELRAIAAKRRQGGPAV
jgi:predicted nucleotidyltransferase